MVKITRLEDTRLRHNAIRVNSPRFSKTMEFRTEFKLYEFIRKYVERSEEEVEVIGL